MRTSRPLRVRFVVGNTSMLWLSTAIAAAAFWPIYQSPGLLVLVVVVTVVGSAIAILGAIRRWSSWLVMLSSVLAYLLLGVPLAVPAETAFGVLPTLQGFLDLLAGTVLSWKQLLTVSLPVGEYQALQIPVFLLVLSCSVGSLSAAIRGKRGDLAVLGPIALYLAAIALGPSVTGLGVTGSEITGSSGAGWTIPLALGLAATTLSWLMWRRWDRRRVTITATTARTRDAVAIGRTLIAAGIVVAIAFVSSVAATNAVPPTGERLVLRSAIIQPFDPRDYVSPLIGFRNYEQPDSIAQAMLTVSGLPNGARIRIATLDSYDGVVYSVGGASASFTRVPSSVDQSGVHGTPVRLTITIDRYAGVWLPVVGQLKTVEFSGPNAQKLRDSFYYDNTSGAAAAVSAVAAGDRYTLAAVLPVQPSSTQLPSLTPGSAEVPPVAVVPDQLPAVLDRYVTAADTPGRRLAAMIDGLKADGYLSHGLSGETPSRSGHSAERITELLTGQRMIGDQEQYAVTAALMARQLGFPARVVVGFAPASAASATATAAAGAITTVVGGDISAWIEVNTAQYGWVTIDPTPAIRPIPVTKPQEPAQVARPQSPVQPQLQEPDKRNAQLPPGSLRDNPAQPNPFLAVLFQVLGVLGWSALALMVVISPFLVIAVAKLRRRILRSRAPTPVRRISGGWQEFEDSIIDYGYLPARAATRSEVARVVGGSQPLALASVVDRAVFSPDRSDAVAADAVWRAVSELRASLARRATRRQRITAVFSVRSLGGTGMRNRVKE